MVPRLRPAALSAPAATPVPSVPSRQPQCSAFQGHSAVQGCSLREAEQTWTCSLACEFLLRPFPPCCVFRLVPSAREVLWVTEGQGPTVASASPVRPSPRHLRASQSCC